MQRRPSKDTTRINETIRAEKVRLIGKDGEQIGIVVLEDALEQAWSQDLDLVEIVPHADPAVCRVMDYSKHKYEQEKKRKEARKNQQKVVVREIKFRPKIATHDYETKKKHVLRFLKDKDRVKITIMFRGRENEHTKLGEELLQRIIRDTQEIAIVGQGPNREGKTMFALLVAKS